MTPPLASAAARERGRELRTELRAELRSRFKSFLETVARATEAALLVDYDGTLAPFSIERDQASPYPGIALALQEIARHGRTRLAVISGRDASEVLALLNIHPPPEVWGLHGLQRLKLTAASSCSAWIREPARVWRMPNAGLIISNCAGMQNLKQAALPCIGED